MINNDKSKCEYCEAPLPHGLNKAQRKIRSHHFEHCEVRLARKHGDQIKSSQSDVQAEAVLRFAAKIYVKHKIDVIDYAKQEADDLQKGI